MNRNYLFKCPSLGHISIALFLFASFAFADVVIIDSKVKANTPNYSMTNITYVLYDANLSMTKPIHVLYDQGYKQVIAFEFTEDKSIKRITDEEGLDYAHPFVAMVGTSFAYHYSMEISPEDIWLMILDGVRLHVKYNRDQLKDKFVRTNADTAIKVTDNTLTMNSPGKQWMENISSIYDSLYKKLPNATRESFNVDFSTSTNVDRFVSKTMVMAVSSAYYSYSIKTLCGIPKMVIKGKKKDWENLKAHFNMIAKELDMPWWAEQVNPILDEFVNVYDKKIDMEFWRGIYKYVPKGKGSGAVPGINGWVTRFFPYINKREYRKNKSLYAGSDDISLNHRTEWNDTLDYDHFTAGRNSVPVNWEYFGKKIELTLYTGFWGVYQDPKTKILRTVRGYALARKFP